MLPSDCANTPTTSFLPFLIAHNVYLRHRRSLENHEEAKLAGGDDTALGEKQNAAAGCVCSI